MDTKCNLRCDARGMMKCHLGLDEELTVAGDTALISDLKQRMLQNVGLWISVKLGERFDPKLGCIFHSFLFAQMDPSELSKMEMQVRENLLYNFPRWQFQEISLTRVTFPDDDIEKLAISIRANNIQLPPIAFDSASLLEFRNDVKRTLANSGLMNVVQPRSY
jgi:phage baseplate assembly protein W